MPTGPVKDPDAWIRPSDWMALPPVVPGNDKIVGLFAVYDYGSNWAGVQISGAYTVDWGDGTVTNHAAGTIASRNIAWSNVPPSTLTSNGYRQAIITITPQAGQQLTNVVLCRQPAGITPESTNWLDMVVALPHATACQVSGSPSVTTPTVMRSAFLERFEMVGPTALTTAESMFNNASALQSVPLFDTSNVTSMSNMFNSCLALQSVPLFNTVNVTTMAGMFSNGGVLQSVPLFNTANVTTMESMFSSCWCLESVPLFDTANVTTTANMLLGCRLLQSVPLFNTANVTTFQSMFQLCQRLRSLPLFDTRKVTTFSFTFNSCESLTSIPELDLRSLTVYTAFSGCTQLQRVGFTPRRSGTVGLKLSASQLDGVYTRLPSLLARTVTNAAGDGTTVTYTTSVAHNYLPGMVISMTGISPVAYNLATQTITDCPTPTTFTVTNAATGAFVSGGTATPAAATLTVTGNPGTTSDTPAIATAKGWTVTG